MALPLVCWRRRRQAGRDANCRRPEQSGQPAAVVLFCIRARVPMKDDWNAHNRRPLARLRLSRARFYGRLMTRAGRRPRSYARCEAAGRRRRLRKGKLWSLDCVSASRASIIEPAALHLFLCPLAAGAWSHSSFHVARATKHARPASSAVQSIVPDGPARNEPVRAGVDQPQRGARRSPAVSSCSHVGATRQRIRPEPTATATWNATGGATLSASAKWRAACQIYLAASRSARPLPVSAGRARRTR